MEKWMWYRALSDELLLTNEKGEIISRHSYAMGGIPSALAVSRHEVIEAPIAYATKIEGPGDVMSSSRLVDPMNAAINEEEQDLTVDETIPDNDNEEFDRLREEAEALKVEAQEAKAEAERLKDKADSALIELLKAKEDLNGMESQREAAVQNLIKDLENLQLQAGKIAAVNIEVKNEDKVSAANSESEPRGKTSCDECQSGDVSGEGCASDDSPDKEPSDDVSSKGCASDNSPNKDTSDNVSIEGCTSDSSLNKDPSDNVSSEGCASEKSPCKVEESLSSGTVSVTQSARLLTDTQKADIEDMKTCYGSIILGIDQIKMHVEAVHQELIKAERQVVMLRKENQELETKARENLKIASEQNLEDNQLRTNAVSNSKLVKTSSSTSGPPKRPSSTSGLPPKRPSTSGLPPKRPSSTSGPPPKRKKSLLSKIKKSFRGVPKFDVPHFDLDPLGVFDSDDDRDEEITKLQDELSRVRSRAREQMLKRKQKIRFLEGENEAIKTKLAMAEKKLATVQRKNLSLLSENKEMKKEILKLKEEEKQLQEALQQVRELAASKEKGESLQEKAIDLIEKIFPGLLSD